jgi:hypothetical protein
MASPEPSKDLLNHPARRQDHETAGGIGSLDDLDGPVALAIEGPAQLWTDMAAVRKNVAQPADAWIECRMSGDTTNWPSGDMSNWPAS